MHERKNIARAAGAMSAATFISRVLGYVRDMVLAFYFGATGVSDTFLVAFRIPNLLRDIFAEGSMSAGLIPVLTEYHKERGQEEARRLVRIVIGFALVVVSSAMLLGIVFAPWIVSFIAPGFKGSIEKFELTVTLTRIMFPFLLCVSLAAIFMGALNARRIFFVPALAPATFNIVVIACMVLLSGGFMDPIYAVAVGVTLGGVAQFVSQAPTFKRAGYSFSPLFDFKDPGLKKMLTLTIPVTIGMAANQINIVVSNIIASFLPSGSITYLFYSMHLVMFPIGIFGVAMGMAVLPSLSAHALKGDMPLLKKDFSFALRLLFFITVPSMIGLIALRVPIVSTLFQRGKFDYAATLGTSSAMIYYGMGIWSIVGAKVLASTFYSMQDTKTPLGVAAAGLALNAFLSVMLMGPMSYRGLALANTCASIFNFTALLFLLRRRIGVIGFGNIASSFLKVLTASSIMGAAGWYLLQGQLWAQKGLSAQKGAYLGGTIILCIGLYLGLAKAFRVEEADYSVKMIVDKLRRKKT